MTYDEELYGNPDEYWEMLDKHLNMSPKWKVQFPDDFKEAFK